MYCLESFNNHGRRFLLPWKKRKPPPVARREMVAKRALHTVFLGAYSIGTVLQYDMAGGSFTYYNSKSLWRPGRAPTTTPTAGEGEAASKRRSSPRRPSSGRGRSCRTFCSCDGWPPAARPPPPCRRRRRLSAALNRRGSAATSKRCCSRRRRRWRKRTRRKTAGRGEGAGAGGGGSRGPREGVHPGQVFNIERKQK